MVAFRFFVHRPDSDGGGFERKHFADNETLARRIIDNWNSERPGAVTLLGIEEIKSDKNDMEVRA